MVKFKPTFNLKHFIELIMAFTFTYEYHLWTPHFHILENLSPAMLLKNEILWP